MKLHPHPCSAVCYGITTLLWFAFSLLPAAAAQEVKTAAPVSDLPPVIRAAIEKAVPAGEILEVQKEVEGENPGQYDVVVYGSGQRYEIEISPQGKILEQKEVAVESEGSEGVVEKKWSRSFGQEGCTFSTAGRNRFFVLEPGHQLTLESADAKIVITVLQETKRIGKVETRVVEEREEEEGELIEVSRNFFAICKEHGDVFYFGEEVDDYQDGKVVGHGGAWRADEPDCHAGIMMPGTALLGARHYQEIAPNALDRAEVIRDDVTFKTPAGLFENCLLIEETTPLEPGSVSYKTYAPGIGLIQDEDLILTRVRPGTPAR